MDYINQIELFTPSNEQEIVDKNIILSFAKAHPQNVLLRDNAIAHITGSGFVMNKSLDKALLVHHNIRNAWAWTGGHADGECDLLFVALKEAREETGIVNVTPLFSEIASLDVLPVFAHERKGIYVNSHLHLGVAYILICDENEPIRPRFSENTDVAWFDLSYFNKNNFAAHEVYLYNKLINRALEAK